jgi:hypothetical protein
MERLPKSLHASVGHVLRQAWELDDAENSGTSRGRSIVKPQGDTERSDVEP